jgi:hypothetical protein
MRKHEVEISQLKRGVKMAKYTTQLRHVVESGVDIFDYDYPIFDASYRGVLEKKIIDFYYFREIGLETVAQFKHFLRTKLTIVMPYYNQLYETNGLITKDNYNINLDNTITKTNKVESDSTGESTGNNTDKTIFSDTPQANLDGKDYATNLTDGEGQSEIHTSGKVTTLEEYTEHLLGNGSMRYNADILQEWRDTFINIDKMVIDELQDLFMNIY